MLTQELAGGVGADLANLKTALDKFLQDYRRLCAHFGGPDWQKSRMEMAFHNARRELIPLMEQAGMDSKAIQALCSWAEKQEMPS